MFYCSRPGEVHIYCTCMPFTGQMLFNGKDWLQILKLMEVMKPYVLVYSPNASRVERPSDPLMKYVYCLKNSFHVQVITNEVC